MRITSIPSEVHDGPPQFAAVRLRDAQIAALSKLVKETGGERTDGKPGPRQITDVRVTVRMRSGVKGEDGLPWLPGTEQQATPAFARSLLRNNKADLVED